MSREELWRCWLIRTNLFLVRRWLFKADLLVKSEFDPVCLHKLLSHQWLIRLKFRFPGLVSRSKHIDLLILIINQLQCIQCWLIGISFSLVEFRCWFTHLRRIFHLCTKDIPILWKSWLIKVFCLYYNTVQSHGELLRIDGSILLDWTELCGRSKNIWFSSLDCLLLNSLVMPIIKTFHIYFIGLTSEVYIRLLMWLERLIFFSTFVDCRCSISYCCTIVHCCMLFPLFFDIPSSLILMTLLDTLSNQTPQIVWLLWWICLHIAYWWYTHMIHASEILIATWPLTWVWGDTTDRDHTAHGIIHHLDSRIFLIHHSSLVNLRVVIVWRNWMAICMMGSMHLHGWHMYWVISVIKCHVRRIIVAIWIDWHRLKRSLGVMME